MKYIIGVSFLFLFASVSIFAQNDLSTMRNTIQQLENEWVKAYIAGDAVALANMYTDDAYSMPDNTPMWKGKDQILDGNRKEMKSGVKYTNLIDKTIEVFGSGDLVYEVGTYTMTYIPANSTEPVTDNGKYLDIWQKQADGSWKVKADIWNSNLTPPTTTQAGAKQKVKNGDFR